MIAIPLKAMHLVAIAIWTGGLLWLVIREPTDRARFAGEAQQVSKLALVAVFLVVGSGVIQTLILLRVRDLWSTYGAIVGAKLLGLALLVAFGAYHRYVVVPRLGTTTAGDTPLTFRKSVRREIAVMSLVILLGGLLSYISPPARAADINHPESTESSS
jgi:putative copper resistance protein D